MIRHVLVLEDGQVLAWNERAHRLPEFEGQLADVREKLVGALAEKHTIERQSGDEYRRISRWQL